MSTVTNPAAILVRSQTFGDLVYTDDIPDTLISQLLPGACAILGSCPSGHILTQQIHTDDVSIWHYTIILNCDDSFQVAFEQTVCSLNFCLQNSFLLHKAGSGEHFTFHEGQYNASFFPRLDLIAQFRQHQVYRFLSFVYSPACLAKFARVYPFLASFLEETSASHEVFLYPANQYGNKELKKIISRMLCAECKEEEIRSCIRKGRALEVLVQVLEKIPQQISQPHIGLTREDAEKIYEARLWLEQQFNRPITLFELSRKAGMNVHKLSGGFMQITGTTIFHYHRKIRMKKAIELLEKTDRNLFDIATEVGYTDDKSFAKEFKKRTGITPFEYRRRLRMQQAS